MRQFAATFKRGRQTDNFGDGILLPVQFITSISINGFKEGDTIWLIKLLRSIAPRLEQGIRRDGVTHDATSQWAAQNSSAPCAVQEPIIGHVVVITNCIRSGVRQRAAHLW